MLNENFVVFTPPLPSVDDYQLLIPADNYSPSEIVIVQIDLSYHFPYYDESSNNYILGLQKNNGFINFDASSRITIILYDYNQELILDSRLGEVILNQSISPEFVITFKCQFVDKSAWRGTALVSSVEGPFQDGILVSELNLEKSVYYLAVPNSNELHDTQLLSIKWSYLYDGGESAKFKHSQRSIFFDKGKKKCKIECLFHNRKDIYEVSIFAYFKTISPQVKKTSSTANTSNGGGGLSNLIWSSKFTDKELNKIIEISARLFCDPNHLIAAMALETIGTFSPAIINGDGYTGLIQIGSVAAQDINRRKGTNITAGKNGNLKNMSRYDQLTIVEYYLEPKKGKLNTLGDLYLAILFPVDCGKGNEPNHVVFDKNIELTYKNGKVVKNTAFYRRISYASNPAFHLEKPEQGKTYVWEITQVIETWYKRGVSNKRTVANSPEKTTDSDSPAVTSSPGDGSWHDPVDNPRLNKYNYSGVEKPASATYGWCRRNEDGSKKYHPGVDFFALPGKDKVYACLDSVLHQVTFSAEAGWIVRIKLNNVADLLAQEKKVNYTPAFNDELKGIDITEKDDVYLVYMHLQKVFFTEKDAKDRKELTAGTALGYAGVSGSIASGGRAPHLHFEVSRVFNPFGTGEKNRTNGARFVKLNSYDTKDQDEAKKNAHKHKP